MSTQEESWERERKKIEADYIDVEKKGYGTAVTVMVSVMAYVSCALKSSESVWILAKLLMTKQYELLEDE